MIINVKTPYNELVGRFFVRKSRDIMIIYIAVIAMHN